MIIILIYHNNAPYTVTQVNVGVNNYFQKFYIFYRNNFTKIYHIISIQPYAPECDPVIRQASSSSTSS